MTHRVAPARTPPNPDYVGMITTETTSWYSFALVFVVFCMLALHCVVYIWLRSGDPCRFEGTCMVDGIYGIVIFQCTIPVWDTSIYITSFFVSCVNVGVDTTPIPRHLLSRCSP